MDLIEVKHLTRVYGDRVAVQDVSFKISGGKIYGLLGPNGAGKSTTMNMMTGCLTPTQGSVNINGFDVVEQPLQAKRLIGYLPEQPPLYGDMTPEEYLHFIAEVKGVDASRAASRVKEVMALTDLEDSKDRLIRQLSKGCRQRVGIAQAILGDPEVIILDEPTVGLDPRQIHDVRDLIRQLGKTRTVLISSHILSEISELCDELLVIADGRLVASGTLEQLQAAVGERAALCLSVRGDAQGICEVLDGMGLSGRYTLLEQTQPDVTELALEDDGRSEVRDEVFFAMADHKYAVLSMEREEQTLERVFLKLTGQSTAAQAQTQPGGCDTGAQAEGETVMQKTEDEEARA